MEWIQSLKGLRGKSGANGSNKKSKKKIPSEAEPFGTRRRKSSLSSSLRSKFRWSMGQPDLKDKDKDKDKDSSVSVGEWEKERQFEAKLRQERLLGGDGIRHLRCRSQIIEGPPRSEEARRGKGFGPSSPWPPSRPASSCSHSVSLYSPLSPPLASPPPPSFVGVSDQDEDSAKFSDTASSSYVVNQSQRGGENGAPIRGGRESRGDQLISSSETCPSCQRIYDQSTRHKKLIDSSCGHARCYECMFKFESCFQCLAPGGEAAAAASSHHDIDSGGSPMSHRSNSAYSSSAFGRESGFQSYCSINSINSALPLDDLQSQCSSSMSLMSAGQFDRNDALKRRSFCSSRDSSSSRLGFGGLNQGFSSRMSYARRSSYIPQTKFREMTAINEQQPMDQFDNRSLLSPTPSSISHVRSPTYLQHHRGGGLNRDHRGVPSRHAPSGFKCSSPKEETSPFSENDFFVGRRWLFREIIDHFATDLPTNGGILIHGGPGTGKTSILKRLVHGLCGFSSSPYTRDLSNRTISHHFLASDNEPTCLISKFVQNVAANLLQCPSLSPYHDLIAADPKLRHLISEEACAFDPWQSFVAGILNPLKQLKSQGRLPQRYYLILIDALCEGECHRNERGESILGFLERVLGENVLPGWIKFICTVRTGLLDLAKKLPFQRFSLDDNGFDERLSKDTKEYIHSRFKSNPKIILNSTPVSWRQEESPQAILTEHLVRSAVGCFLYLKLTLDLLERGSLVIKSSSFNVIPHSLSEIFLLNLNLVFSSEVAFTQTKTVFSICLAALKPMSLEQVYSCTRALEQESEAEGQTTWANFNQAYKTTMSQFLPLDSSTNKVSFFHPTFRDWLNGRRSTESNKFVCDPRIGHSAIALYLARNPRSLNEIQTLDLAHHVLKAQIFKSQTQSVSIKELQATWVSLASDNVSKALCCSKNLSSPNYVISKLLLLAGASPESSIRISSDNLFERPLLCHFAESGNEDMTSLLLEFGADVCCSDSEGVTPLMIAARANHAKLVDFLLTKGSVVNQCCTKGWTALTFASMNNSVEALEKLLSTTTRSWPNSGCNRDQAIQEALVAASTVQALQLLLQEGDVNRKSPISDEFPLERAINLGKREICEFLLQNGAKLDILSSPLHVAVMKGHWSIVDLLLKSRPGAIGEKDKLGRPALVVASSQGQISIMELLILKGASVNETDSEGITPLSWACIKNQESCVQFLLKHNDLNVHKEDNRGRTCLHHAAMTGNDQILTDILDKTDANIETCDENGIRPIDQAISYGNKLCVQTFLRKGAKLGPTTWAMAKGKQIILLVLLNKLLEDGNTLYRKNRIREAIFRYEYALNRLPDTEILHQAKSQSRRHLAIFLQLKSHLLLNLSRAERKRESYSTAISRATQVLSFNPGSHEAFWARAKAKWEAGNQMEETLKDLREAIKISPQSLELHRFAVLVQEKISEKEREKRELAVDHAEKGKNEKEEKKLIKDDHQDGKENDDGNVVTLAVN